MLLLSLLTPALAGNVKMKDNPKWKQWYSVIGGQDSDRVSVVMTMGYDARLATQVVVLPAWVLGRSGTQEVGVAQLGLKI